MSACWTAVAVAGEVSPLRMTAGMGLAKCRRRCSMSLQPVAGAGDLVVADDDVGRLVTRPQAGEQGGPGCRRR